MPTNQRGRTPPRDFAFQSIDQSLVHQFGGAEAASQHAFSAQPAVHYEADPATNVSGAPTIHTQGPAQEPSLGYQSSVAQDGAPAQYPSSYDLSTEPSLVWDWGNAIDFSDFTNHPVTVGELAHELQTQNEPTTGFSIPPTVSHTETGHQPSQQALPAQPTAQYTSSSSPRPPHTGMKRKAGPELSAQAADGQFQENPSKRQAQSRASPIASTASPAVAAATALDHRSYNAATMDASATLESISQSNNETQKRRETSKGTGPQGRVIDVSTPRRIVESRSGADILPSGKVFPMQIGSELFRLSGASISSDAPSYFSHFFGEQIHNNEGRAGEIKTLYIDRDPDTFRDIALHLQGYHVSPRNGEHFVHLFADAQFYSLPRLTKQLFSTDIFIRIGDVPFQIPRDLFSSPGDSPNYFTLGFAQFFSTPMEVFPGLDRNALLRPPPISPPSVPNRSGETFGELMKILQGYPVDIRNDAHRSQLLRDARYFHLRGLEQKLIPCETSYNLRRAQSEILIRLDDVRQSGLSFTPDTPVGISGSGSGSDTPSHPGISPAPSSKPTSPAPSPSTSNFRAGTISYARPYTDDHASTNILILELSLTESTTLHLPIDAPRPLPSEPLTLNMRATFHGSTLARITSLFSVIASKMGLPATQPLGLMMLQSGGGVAAQPVSSANSGLSERRVRVRIDDECYMVIDNVPAELAVDAETGRLGIRREGGGGPHKRTKVGEGRGKQEVSEWIWGGAKETDVEVRDGEEQEEQVVVKGAHWRIRIENVDGESAKMQVVLCGVRIEGYIGEKSRNQGRSFLS